MDICFFVACILAVIKGKHVKMTKPKGHKQLRAMPSFSLLSCTLLLLMVPPRILGLVSSLRDPSPLFQY
jgi:hypothetical protein